MLGEGRVTRSEPAPGRTGAPSNAPTYQHRHRPDMPPPAAPVQSAGASSSGGSSTSTGTRGDMGEEAGRKKVVGGFAMPGGTGNGGPSGLVNAGRQQAASRTPPESAADAAARRRAAIKASFGNDAPQAPSIPVGGVDSVASRANQNLRAHGADLGIPNANSGGFGGFGSARGVKRER